jgi:hypothetical protein
MKYSLVATFCLAILIYLWAILFNNVPVGLMWFLWACIALKCVLIILIVTQQDANPTKYYAFGWYVIFYKHYAVDPYYKWPHLERENREIRIEWRRVCKVLITELPF